MMSSNWLPILFHFTTLGRFCIGIMFWIRTLQCPCCIQCARGFFSFFSQYLTARIIRVGAWSMRSGLRGWSHRRVFPTWHCDLREVTRPSLWFFLGWRMLSISCFPRCRRLRWWQRQFRLFWCFGSVHSCAQIRTLRSASFLNLFRIWITNGFVSILLMCDVVNSSREWSI